MPAANVLKIGDVILAFDGHAVANDGTVEFRRRERISCDCLVSAMHIGTEAVIKV